MNKVNFKCLWYRFRTNKYNKVIEGRKYFQIIKWIKNIIIWYQKYFKWF